MTQQATNFITTPSWEMDENFKLLAKHNMLHYKIHVLNGAHFPYFPNELEIMITKSMQEEVGKFPIIISYCFLFEVLSHNILLFHPYPKTKTSNGGLKVATRS
jgi:hypothetical protein